ncbi:YcaO-like family protein [Spirillospora sp. CA-294931]|uniref:YcaO-like family protein n=1 Tax=Spirillospora sp. CA-294931 TaxID=3240042 RepID=UPI003D8A2D56
MRLVSHRWDIEPGPLGHLNRLVGHLTGVQPGLSVLNRDDTLPRVVVIKGRSPATGCGVQLEEAVMGMLHRSVERHARLTYTCFTERGTAEEMAALYGQHHVLPVDGHQECDWTQSVDVATGDPYWVPLEVAVAGPPTGTAARTAPGQALRAALFDLVQGHVATEHWYSGETAPQVALDARTPALGRVLARDVPVQAAVRFHRLGGERLGVHVVAGVLEHASATAVGLGTGTVLETAMYRAYLAANAADPVRPEHLGGRLAPGHRVPASELPPDRAASPERELRAVTDRVLDGRARLTLLDLTGPEIADLGFHVYRFLSADLFPVRAEGPPPYL